MSEKTKMISGALYNAADPELTADRLRARQLCHDINTTRPDTAGTVKALVAQLVPGVPASVQITPPFQCDYGYNLTLGEGVYFNVNCVVLDVARVRIGAHTMCGPAVQLYTATHPLDAAQRRRGVESGAPIDIGEDVWIGGGAIVCPGVQIGDRTVVGAGSVVTRSLPADVLAAGNPCRVIRALVPGEAPGNPT